MSSFYLYNVGLLETESQSMKDKIVQFKINLSNRPQKLLLSFLERL